MIFLKSVARKSLKICLQYKKNVPNNKKNSEILKLVTRKKNAKFVSGSLEKKKIRNLLISHEKNSKIWPIGCKTVTNFQINRKKTS